MDLQYSSIIEYLKFKSLNILCEIQIKPRNITFYKQTSAIKSHHWMHEELWSKFYQGLETILNEVNCLTLEKQFNINALIKVRVKKSTKSAKTLWEIVGEDVNKVDVAFVLNCTVQYQEEEINFENNCEPLIFSKYETDKEESHEYEPQSISSHLKPSGLEKGGSLIETFPTYVPYRPNLKNVVEDDENEEQYSPKPLDTNLDVGFMETPVPKYSPARIKRNSESKNGDKSKEPTKTPKSENGNMNIISSSKNKSKHSNSDKKTERKKELSSKISPEECPTDVIKTSQFTKDSLSAEESVLIDNASVVTTNQVINEKNAKDDEVEKCSRPTAKATINRDLFGTDDEEVEHKGDTSNIDTHQSKKKSRHKRKYEHSEKNVEEKQKSYRDKDSDKKKCDENRSTKKKSRRHDESKNKHSKNLYNSDSTSRESRKPEKEAAETKRDSSAKLEEKKKAEIENSLKLKAFFEERLNEKPPEVEMLTLKNISLEDILNSFEIHKPLLDEIFCDKSNKKYEKGYKGNDHFLVINLLDNENQLEMMHKLTATYEKNQTGSSAYTFLFANAMLPEWIIGIFMDKFKFSRDDALKQLKAQNAYKLHLDSEKHNPLFL